MREYRIGRLKGRFVVTWTEGGARRRFRLEALTAKDAEREARDLIMKQTAPPSGMTVQQVWTAYQTELGERRMAGKMQESGKNVLPVLGHLAAAQITRDDCRRYISDRRMVGRKDGTIRTELGCLRASLLWARRVRLIAFAPQIELPPVPAPRDRYLTRAEVGRLLSAARDPHIHLAMLLLLTTAGRIGAVLELTWSRVDLDRRMIRLATNDIGPKKGRATVPVNDTLLQALLVAQRAALSPYVVEYAGRRVTSIKTGFSAAVKRAGIEHCTIHDLRRTAGRFMVEAGVPIEEVAQYLGHSNPNVTRTTYAQFSPDHLRRASRALEF
jgi:integrase